MAKQRSASSDLGIGGGGAGKGSSPRNCFSQQFRDNFDAIDWHRAVNNSPGVYFERRENDLVDLDKRERWTKDSLVKYRQAQKDVSEAYENLTDTLREDYEISTAPDGRFYVSYGCSCTKCGFAFTFKHEAFPDLNNRPYKKT